MGFDPMFQLMVNGAQAQIVLEIFEGRFHFGQLDVKLPEFFRRSPRDHVAAQQVTAFAFARLAQFVFAQSEGQCGRFAAPPSCRSSALAIGYSCKAAPSFLSSSSRLSFIPCNFLSRCHSPLSCRRRMARSLFTRSWLSART